MQHILRAVISRANKGETTVSGSTQDYLFPCLACNQKVNVPCDWSSVVLAPARVNPAEAARNVLQNVACTFMKGQPIVTFRQLSDYKVGRSLWSACW